ncbi:hypothetical protein SC1083_1535 [Aggregatibacter actinomycetemcomitans serotype e str. SC1083]|uniref:Uncharacterized protein n=1 Tax=Aggregatibacter actinomycetemcomitans serotype e str. SC1083 TaxID=907488 RepID=G4A9L8_AGGAC|nr:hypothetical protein SC1083_1535 [Aggregatibacter actinomycetemcomitans serotype e str. SC1083]
MMTILSLLSAPSLSYFALSLLPFFPFYSLFLYAIRVLFQKQASNQLPSLSTLS